MPVARESHHFDRCEDLAQQPQESLQEITKNAVSIPPVSRWSPSKLYDSESPEGVAPVVDMVYIVVILDHCSKIDPNYVASGT